VTKSGRLPVLARCQSASVSAPNGAEYVVLSVHPPWCKPPITPTTV
jgi:hypothetical protein